MLICAAHGYPGEGRPDVETFVGAKLPFGELRETVLARVMEYSDFVIATIDSGFSVSFYHVQYIYICKT